jgi:hypothetical protein
MEILHTNSPLPSIAGVEDISGSSGNCYDYSGLANPQIKKEFLYQYRDQVNYDLQMMHSSTVHNVSNFYNLADATLINTEEITINDLLLGIEKPIYKFYRLLEWDQSGNSLVMGDVNDSMAMPIIEPNYFSSVFLFGIKKLHGGDSRVLFFELESTQATNSSVLGLKIEDDSLYGLYNISYRSPYDSLGLI